MASGTGLTTGPYSLSGTTTIELDDPNAQGGQVSQTVQIQNQSGVTLTVYSAGAPYTIPAHQATTIPTAVGGQSLTAVSSATNGGTFTAVWLLSGQSPPIPDGPLNPSDAVGYLIPIFPGVTTHVFTVSSTVFTDTWPIDYSVQQVNLNLTLTGVGAGSVVVKIEGVTSGQVYFLKTYTSSVANAYSTFSVFGSADSSIKITFTNTGGTFPTVRYQLTATESTASSNDVVLIGGTQLATATSITPGTTVTALVAPGYNLAYRLHSWTVNKAITSTSDYLTLQGLTTGTILDVATTYSTGKYLGGLVISEGVAIKNSAATVTFQATVAYDLIISPIIS